MYQIIYASQSVHYFSKPELTTLVEHAGQRNRALNVTGILIYLDGEFMQLLEGDKQDVKFLMALIEKDSRHHSISILKENEIQSRRFNQWSMASQFMTKSLMRYILSDDNSLTSNLRNLFTDQADLAETMMIKLRDRVLIGQETTT